MLPTTFNPSTTSHFRPSFLPQLYNSCTTLLRAGRSLKNSFPLTTFMSKVLYWSSAVGQGQQQLPFFQYHHTGIGTLGVHCMSTTLNKGTQNYISTSGAKDRHFLRADFVTFTKLAEGARDFPG